MSRQNTPLRIRFREAFAQASFAANVSHSLRFAGDTPVRFGALDVRKARPRNGSPNARCFSRLSGCDEVGPDAQDHAVKRFRYLPALRPMSGAHRRIAASRPEKIASPTRKVSDVKFPDFAECGNGPYVCNQTCPAWISSQRSTIFRSRRSIELAVPFIRICLRRLRNKHLLQFDDGSTHRTGRLDLAQFGLYEERNANVRVCKAAHDVFQAVVLAGGGRYRLPSSVPRVFPERRKPHEAGDAGNLLHFRVAAISRLSGKGISRLSVRYPDRKCALRSSLKWAVMPSAPACSAAFAARTGLDASAARIADGGYVIDVDAQTETAHATALSCGPRTRSTDSTADLPQSAEYVL